MTPDGRIAEPTRTPDWTVAFGGSYELELGSNGMSLVPSINASYRSSQETNSANYTIYAGSITGTNGTYPANPYDGDIITGGGVTAGLDFAFTLLAELAGDDYAEGVQLGLEYAPAPPFQNFPNGAGAPNRWNWPPARPSRMKSPNSIK